MMLKEDIHTPACQGLRHSWGTLAHHFVLSQRNPEVVTDVSPIGISHEEGFVFQLNQPDRFQHRTRRCLYDNIEHF